MPPYPAGCPVPTAHALKPLADDYVRMAEDRLFLNEAESFNTLLAQCEAVQNSANGR
jgi:hypothetical protein